MPLDISLDQFRSISDGKYNAGQIDVTVKKDGTATLKKVNAHVHLTSLNTTTIDPAQTLEIKQAFVRAIAPHVNEEDAARIREDLGLPATEGGTVRSGHAYEPLTRQQVRTILDAYVPPEVRKARAEDAKRTSVRASVNAANLSAQPIRVGEQALRIDKIGTDAIHADGFGLPDKVEGSNIRIRDMLAVEEAAEGMKKAADGLISALRRSDGKRTDLTTLVRKLNTLVAYAERAAALDNANPTHADVARFVNATLARALDQLDNGTLAIVYQGTMSRELDGLKAEVSRRLTNPDTLPSQFETCDQLLEGISRLEARVVSEVSYRVELGKTPQEERADIQSPVQRWCGAAATPTAHDGAGEMTAVNLEILARRADDALRHSDATSDGVDARLRSHGLTGTDSRKIGDMIRSTELTLNIHLGSIVGWHGGLAPALGNPNFALRNTFASKEAQDLPLDGTGYLVKRDVVEKYYFPEYGAIPLSGRDRPLYAALNPAKAASGGIGGSAGYGSTVVVLKPHVKQQATYTIDDTFNPIKISTTAEGRQAFVKALASALAGKVAPETIRELSTPGTELYNIVDTFYAYQGGAPVDAAKTEKTICKYLADHLADKFNPGVAPLDFNHIHAILIRETAIKRDPSSLTANFDNIEDLLATRDDFLAVGFGVASLRRNDPNGSAPPFRLLGCDYIEAQLHGPIVLGRDVEEIRISETEIMDQALAEYKDLQDKPPEGPAKEKWIAERILLHKKEIADMAYESGVKISFYGGFHEAVDSNNVIAGTNYWADVRAARQHVMDANLQLAEQIVAAEMPALCRRGFPDLSETRKAQFAQIFGENLARLPDWLTDKIGMMARQKVLAAVKDVNLGESVVDAGSIRLYLVEQARNIMDDMAKVFSALDRYKVDDPALREDILKQFVQSGWPIEKLGAIIAPKVVIDRVMNSPETILDAAMKAGFPESVRVELSTLGAKDGLPLARRGLEIVQGAAYKFLAEKLSAGESTDVDKLLAEVLDKFFIPAMQKRIELLLPTASWTFPSEEERKAFVDWVVNAGTLKKLEQVEGAYAASERLADDLVAALSGDGAIDVARLVEMHRTFEKIISEYGDRATKAGLEIGTDDLHALVFRPVNVAMSRLEVRLGQAAMVKLGAALAKPEVRSLFAAVSSALAKGAESKVVGGIDTTRMHTLMLFLGELGDRLTKKYGQSCKFDATYVAPFSSVSPAMRQVLSSVQPELIDELAAKTPYEPTFKTIPAPANPDGLPTDLDGRKGFLRAALPTYRQHENDFDGGINTHGRTHATRTFVLANVLGNILAERGVPVDMNALSLGAAGHDMGRKGSGPDKWERESGDLAAALGEQLTGGAGGAAWSGAVKANVAGKAPELDAQRTIEGYLLKAADSLDYTRVDKVDPTHLHFLDKVISCGGTIVMPDSSLRRQLIKEAVELTRLTDPYTARKDEMDQLVRDGKMVEHGKIADKVRQAELDQTAKLTDEQIIDLVEQTIRANPDKFPLLNQYYR